MVTIADAIRIDLKASGPRTASELLAYVKEQSTELPMVSDDGIVGNVCEYSAANHFCEELQRLLRSGRVIVYSIHNGILAFNWNFDEFSSEQR